MEQDVLSAFVEESKRIALAAGREIARIAASAGEWKADLKADGSPVTRADTASQAVILSGLEKLRPAHPIVSEESFEGASAAPVEPVFWLVDPLDGTKEFLKANGEYTVNIALVEDATPVLGVIYAPALDVLYYAAQGLGSWKRDAGGMVRRLRRAPVSGPLTAVVSRSHPSPETDGYLAKRTIGRRVERGSSIKMCAVADGEADIYPRLGPTCLWDTAAGAVIAREAGCIVETPEGERLLYDPRRGIKHAGFVVRTP